MELTKLIERIQSHLDSRLEDVAVLVSGSEARPLPAIIIEDVELMPMDGSMNNYHTSMYDENGNETDRVYRRPYDARASFLIRDDNTVASAELFDDLLYELRRLEDRPSRLSNRVSRVRVGSGGGVSHQFVNPAESEFTQSATFTSALVRADDSWETIENIEHDLNIE